MSASCSRRLRVRFSVYWSCRVEFVWGASLTIELSPSASLQLVGQARVEFPSVSSCFLEVAGQAYGQAGVERLS